MVNFLFGFNASKGAWLAKAIARLQGGVSHSAVQMFDGERDYVFESRYPLSRTTNFEHFSSVYKNMKVIYFKTSELERAEMLSWLKAQMGKEYSFAQLVFNLLTMVFPLFSHISKRWSLNSRAKLVCAELLAEFIERFSSYRFDENLDRVDLKDVYKMLMKIKREHNGVWPYHHG